MFDDMNEVRELFALWRQHMVQLEADAVAYLRGRRARSLSDIGAVS